MRNTILKFVPVLLLSSGGVQASSDQFIGQGAVAEQESATSPVACGSVVNCMSLQNIEPAAGGTCLLADGRTRSPGALVYNRDHKVLQYCDGQNWIALGFGCARDVSPDPILFTDTEAGGSNQLTASEILQITGIDSEIGVKISGEGDPHYRICSDATCSAVLQNWTNAPGVVGPDKYIQLRMTSNSATGEPSRAVAVIGTDAAPWSTLQPKIVCTAMNQIYGLGQFRARIWLAYSARALKPEHQAGYHFLATPLVAFAYGGRTAPRRILRTCLEHLARRRTYDLWLQKRGRCDLIGRIERMVLESVCLIIGIAVRKAGAEDVVAARARAVLLQIEDVNRSTANCATVSLSPSLHQERKPDFERILT